MERRGTLQGVAYTNSPNLPAEFRDCPYVVSYGNGEIHRVRLTRAGNSYEAQTSLFARVPGALDLTIDEAGTFYVSCFEQKTIYRLRLTKENN